jgi:hypothetical protein
VGTGTRQIAYSTDNGSSWTGQSVAFSIGKGIATNGNIVIAVGNGPILYSSNGTTWNAISNTIFTTTIEKICWNGDRFIAVGSGTNSIAYSNDGLTWTGLGTTIFTVSGSGIKSNARLGFPIFDSQLILYSKQLDITSESYQQGYKTMSATIKNTSLI